MIPVFYANRLYFCIFSVTDGHFFLILQEILEEQLSVWTFHFRIVQHIKRRYKNTKCLMLNADPDIKAVRSIFNIWGLVRSFDSEFGHHMIKKNVDMLYNSVVSCGLKKLTLSSFAPVISLAWSYCIEETTALQCYHIQDIKDLSSTLAYI